MYTHTQTENFILNQLRVNYINHGPLMLPWVFPKNRDSLLHNHSTFTISSKFNTRDTCVSLILHNCVIGHNVLYSAFFPSSIGSSLNQVLHLSKEINVCKCVSWTHVCTASTVLWLPALCASEFVSELICPTCPSGLLTYSRASISWALTQKKREGGGWDGPDCPLSERQTLGWPPDSMDV